MEFIILETILAICMSYKGFFRRSLGIIYAIILSIQFLSLISIKRFLPAIAMANVNYTGKIYNNPMPIILFFTIVFLIVFLQFITTKFKNKLISNMSIFTFIIFIFFDQTAIGSLVHNLKTIYNSNFTSLNKTQTKIVENNITKDKIVYNSDIDKYLQPKHYNIVLFFMEGFSRIIISKDLTPNLYKISHMSLDVQNYYNHTATTYRGMRGQLTSFYQASSGLTFKFRNKADKILTSLPRILNNLGYETAHQSCENNTTKMSKSFYDIGYKNIIGYNYVYKGANLNNVVNIQQLTDKESYDLAFKKISNLKQPFFYSLYSVGTHFGYQRSIDSIKYKDGKDRMLNNYFNLDYQIGEFFKKFNSSKLADNTILIITADHAAVADKDFNAHFPNNHANNTMVDQIPLFIYKKGVTPTVIDANGLNSLSLAPTICDILGIRNLKNKFLGISIFDKAQPRAENKIGAMDGEFYIIENNETKQIKINDKNKKLLDMISKFEIYGG